MSLHNWRMILENTGDLTMHPQKHVRASISPTRKTTKANHSRFYNKWVVLNQDKWWVDYFSLPLTTCVTFPTREAVASCRDLHSEINFFSGLIQHKHNRGGTENSILFVYGLRSTLNKHMSPKVGVPQLPQNHGFQYQNSRVWDDLGYPYSTYSVWSWLLGYRTVPCDYQMEPCFESTSWITNNSHIMSVQCIRYTSDIIWSYQSMTFF